MLKESLASCVMATHSATHNSATGESGRVVPPPKSSGATMTQKYARARLDAGLFTQEQYDEFETDDANAGDENMGGEETMMAMA